MKTAMMNKSRSLFLLSILAVLFAACEEGIIDNAILSQDYSEPEYAISVSPGELSFSAEGGEEDITLELTRSLSWTATTNDSWITLPTHSGDDSPTSVIHILVAENTSLENRIGTITFKTRGKTATLTVRQEGVEPFLSTDVQTLTFPSDGGAQQVQISTNGNWTATTKSESAFSVSPASGTGEGTLTVTAAENETTVLRWETLTLTSGALTVSVTLLQQAKPDLNGHAYVDLGLPSGLLWATCNVGATTPEEYGDYFAWGETAKKNSYTWSNYKWSDGSMQSLTKYNNRNDYGIVDNLSELLPSDDAAVVNWGGCWRMPTYAEWEELCNTDNCTWTPINNNGHCEGYKVTSTRNGNSIFLPAAGLYTESGFDRAGLNGYFWASTLFSAPDQGCGLYFDDAGHPHAFSRYQGLSVRPVGKMTLHFSLSPTSVNFPAAGSSETLSITANQPWTATTSDAWLTLSADAGTGDATLDVAAEENTSITRRTGTVTFQTGATTYTVTISQEGATPTFNVSPESLSFTASGGSASVTISSNQSWTATTSDAWFSISSAEGEGDATLSLSVVANTSTDSRSGTVTLKAGDSSYTVSVSQEGEDPILSVTPETLSFSADGGNKSITVTSNLSWTATSSDAWLTVSSSSGEGDATLSVTADENVSIANRTASVTFEGKDRTVIVNVTQDGAAPFFNVTPTTLSFSAEGGSAPVKIVSNQTWTASKSADWIALSEVEGTGDATLSLTVDANTSTDSRSGTVAFQAGETYYHINLTQDGKGILFSITPESLSFSADGGNETITVTSNLSWTVTSSDAWLTLSNSSGEGDATLTVVAQENPSTSSRSGILTFKGKDITFTVNVTQEGASPAFSVTPTSLSFTSSGGNQSVSITSNLSWTASFNDSWLSLSNSSGEGDATLSILAQANTSTDNRAGTVTFTAGGKTYSVTIIQDGVATHFDVTPTTLAFTSKGGSKSVSVMSNQPWTASFDVSWLKLSNSSGTSDATLSVTAEENTSTSSRAGTVTFKVGDRNYTVSITQEGADPFFNIAPEALAFTSSAGNKTVSVTSNISWTASSSVSWLTISKTSGTGNASVSVSAQANTSTDNRAGTVTFTAGGKTYTITVTQEGVPTYFEITPTTLSFASSGGSKSISVMANQPWTVSSETSWLKLSDNSGTSEATLSVTAEKNTSTSSRSGTVTFKAGGKTYTVSVTQEGADPTFSISPTSLSFTSSAGSKSVSVTSNTSWTVSSGVSWLTLSKTSGTGNASVSLTTEENTSTSSRSGTVTFKSGGKTYTVSVSQEGADPTFSISPTSLSFTSSAGSKSVSVTSNTSWTVSSGVSWLTLSKSSGTGNASVSLTTEENTSTSSRSATVTFKSGGNSYTISVTQEGAAPSFSVTPTSLSFTSSMGSKSVSVTSNISWAASSNVSWITLSNNSGLGNATVSLTVEDNTTTSSRSGIVTFSAGGKNYTVSVAQAGADPSFSISPTTLSFVASGGSQSITLKSNLSWTVSSSVSWLTLSKTSGTGDASVSITAQANTSTDNRSGIVTFTAGGKTYSVSVSQEGVPTYFEITPTTLSFSASGGSKSISVMSNQPWTVSADASWLKLSDNSGTSDATLSVTAEENTSTSSRSGAITFSAGGNTYQVTVTQEASEQNYEMIDGHAYVDLGLPSGLLWATMNVGASSPETYGDYFAWGEIKTKNDYSWSTYKYCNGNHYSLTKYNDSSSYGIVDNKTILDSNDDAAAINWSGIWRMPTFNEIEELIANCTWTWLTQQNVCGYKVTSKINGNFIFLPAASYYDGANAHDEGSIGNYWSSSLDNYYEYDGHNSRALSLYFDSDQVGNGELGRECGSTIRPVCQPKPIFEVSIETISFISSGGNQSVSVTSNQAWTASTADAWLTLSGTSGTGNASLTITAQANKSACNRTGTITFNAGGTSKTVSVTQEGVEVAKAYLTFEALENTTFTFTQNNLQYSLDGGATWTTLTAGTASPLVQAGNRIMWKASGLTPGSNDPDYGIGTFSSTGKFNAEGNIMSLFYGDSFAGKTSLSGKYFAFYNLFENCEIVNASNLRLPATALADECYRYMFCDCTSLTTAPELPATTLAGSCYRYMFEGCTSLTTPPSILPATTLAKWCYEGMFRGCTNLTTAPSVLPATTLDYSCYNSMFSGCTSLTTAPALPATTLANWCYDRMFEGCTSLTTAPSILPATTLADYCYIGMFRNCTSLTSAPELPATTLANSCYNCMFYGCTSLTTAPELPATTLADECYRYMFFGCTSLTTAPSVLPATTLAQGCYGSMFCGCTSLTTAPSVLPATTLAQGCYGSMFYGCTSLTTAPELPATTLASYCYSFMFSGCTSLNHIKCLATNITATECTTNWVSGVASSGTFVKNASMNFWTTGDNGTPYGWTIQNAK